MPQTRPAVPGTVKTETMILVAFVALILGFVGGVAFGVYKAGKSSLPAATAPAGPDPQLEALQKETVLHPQDSASWARLGHYLFDRDDPDRAIAAYEKSLALNPNNPDLVTDLGVMYRRRGDPQRAVATFDKALAIDPNHEIAMFNKGIVLLHDLQDVDGALEAWQRLLALNPQAATPGGQPLADLVAHVKTHQNQEPLPSAPTGD